MNTQGFTELLSGKDLRRLGQNAIVVRAVHTQKDFDELFALTLGHERPLVMRAVDAIEKITKKHPEYLEPHKIQLLNILKGADHKELKWHIAQLITRITLSKKELNEVWNLLHYWTLNKNESKIVRVNSFQALFEISRAHPEYSTMFRETMSAMQHEMIPSIQARMRKLSRQVN